jgi:Protein of unknown function (DUF2934)
VDLENIRKKQQALLIRMVERMVRSRARQIYESRGQEAGQDLQDWFQAESEVLENNAIAALYRRLQAIPSSGETRNRVENEPAFS